MPTKADEYRDWMRGYLVPRYPELVPAMTKAIDAYASLLDQPDGTREQLQPVEDLARSPKGSVYETATDMLGDLSARVSAARDVIAEMATDKRATIRFNAILCLKSTTPRKLSLHVIGEGLRDKSTRVRIKAGDWALRLRAHDLVSDLESVLSCERSAKVKDELAFDLAMLRDGFLIKDDSGDQVSVSVLMPKGGIRGCTASRREIEEAGLDALVRDIREGRR